MPKSSEHFSDESPSLTPDRLLPDDRRHRPYNVLSYIDLSSRTLAKQLHEARYLYAAYGALDGLSNAYSSWKYIFDIAYNNSSTNSTDALHDWMMSGEGMLLAGFETMVLIAYSTMGNYFDDNSDSLLKSWIARSWPYVRDCIKGAKNAYKGLRSTFQVSTVLSGVSLKHIVVPTSLVLGLFAVSNRLLLRQMYGNRKYMMRRNKELLLLVQGNDIKRIDAQDLQNELQRQSTTERQLAYTGAAFGGLVDGMYMFMGVLSFALGAVSLPVFIYLTCCSLLYLTACIVTRLYEEYGYQQKVDVSIIKVHLAMAGKLTESQLQLRLALLQQIVQNPEAISDEQRLELERLNEAILQQLNTFSRLQKQLSDTQRMSWGDAFLLGIRHGLSAYGSVTSLMFATATIMLFCSMPLPAWVLVAVVSIGLALMTAFVIHAFYSASIQKQRSQQVDNETLETIQDLQATIASHQKSLQSLKIEEMHTKLFHYMTVDPSPQFFFQEWFEVVRSFFSGVGKGSKSIDYTMTAYQEVGEDGHYHHENFFILCLAGLSSLLFSMCLALRALCKGFGRPPVDAVSLPKTSENPHTEAPIFHSKESQAPQKNRHENGLTRTNSAHSFFSKKLSSDPIQRSKSTPPCASSVPDLDTDDPPFQL